MLRKAARWQAVRGEFCGDEVARTFPANASAPWATAWIFQALTLGKRLVFKGERRMTLQMI